MGYRSDIRIVTSKKGFDKLKEYVSDYLKKEKKDDSYNLLNDFTVYKENKYQVYFGWNYLKWYEGSYADVDAIMIGLDKLAENDYSYRYARLGEEYDDYEEQYHESDNEDEQDIEYPNMIREFDDDYVIENLNAQERIEEREAEIST